MYTFIQQFKQQLVDCEKNKSPISKFLSKIYMIACNSEKNHPSNWIVGSSIVTAKFSMELPKSVSISFYALNGFQHFNE